MKFLVVQTIDKDMKIFIIIKFNIKYYFFILFFKNANNFYLYN
jgi:hypothetical protein